MFTPLENDNKKLISSKNIRSIDSDGITLSPTHSVKENSLMGFTIQEILEATQSRLIQGETKSRVKGVSIDSRTIMPKELFIAIAGNNFDGHDFINATIKKSSIGAVVSKIKKIPYPKDYNLIYVKDTIKALGDIARFYRGKFDIPIIAITGSCGKTTAKEMLSEILTTKYNVLKTQGTQNNQIGIPLTLLKLTQKHQVVVLEFGTNHFGEIKYLSRIAQPTIGILTNIGPAHLEFFGNLSSVFQEKSNLVKYLMDNGGSIIYNNDDRFLRKIKSGKANFKIHTFGKTRKSDFFASSIKIDDGSLQFQLNNRFQIKLNTPAEHNVYNALAAIACSRILNISFKSIIGVLSKFEFPPMRMRIEKINNIHIIDDSYNSNPLSLENALKTISSYNSGGRKILVCADMLELGKYSKKLHFSLGRKIPGYSIDILITVGQLSRFFSAGAKSIQNAKILTWDFNSKEKAIDKLLDIVRQDDIILVKGSRLMQLETVTETLRNFLKKK